MKVIIAGSRKIHSLYLLKTAIANSGFIITEVVEGEASGVDTLASNWADDNNIPKKPFPADWDNLLAPGAVIRYTKYGKPFNANAGFDRNQRQADYGEALIAIRLHKDSNGTDDMIRRAKQKKIPIYVMTVDKLGNIIEEKRYD